MSFLSAITGNGDAHVNAPPVTFTPPNFTGGGLNGTFSVNRYGVTPDATRTGAVDDLSNSYTQLGDQTGALRDTVAPGYNDLLKSRLTSFNNNAASAIGTLNQNLQSRRVLGSSFGQDTITRAQNQFNQSRDQIVSDNFLQSLNTNNQLLNQQYSAYSQAANTKLNELNLESSLASTLGSKSADLLNQNAQTEAKLSEDAAKSNATNSISQANGFGNFIGKVAMAPMTGGLSLSGGLGVPSAGASQASMGGGLGGGIFG